jgi:hypothetical protein
MGIMQRQGALCIVLRGATCTAGFAKAQRENITVDLKEGTSVQYSIKVDLRVGAGHMQTRLRNMGARGHILRRFTDLEGGGGGGGNICSVHEQIEKPGQLLDAEGNGKKH